MVGPEHRPRGVLTITVRFGSGYDPPLRISFESYPDIWASKEIGPTVYTIEDACLELRQWLDAFKQRYEGRN